MTTTTTPTITASIFTAFDSWIKQRSKIDYKDYGGDPKAYRQDARTVAQHRARARRALGQAQWYNFNPEAMAEALRSGFSGRLTWTGHDFERFHTPHICRLCSIHKDKHERAHFEYCTGQYFPTEFALAAAVVLERYIEAVRPKHAPAPDAEFNTIAQIKAANHNAGGHWFDRDTLKFFRSRILPGVYSGPGGVFFVSSEEGPHGPRRYTVREFDPKTGDVDTFGPFNEMGRERALRIARIAAHNREAALEATK